MPDTPTSPPKSARDPNAPKYTEEQRNAAEQKVRDAAAKKNDELNKFVDDFSKKLVEQLENEDTNTRTSILDRIVQRVRSIRHVAANTHLSVSRHDVRKEEDVSMPRTITGESRNIMGQQDQNATKELGGKK